MSHNDSTEPRSWWKLVLMGFLAIAFGIAAILLPGGIMFGRILDVIFGEAKPLSGSMTAVAALLGLVVVVAIDALINLFGTGVTDKRVSRVRGVIGIAVVIAAIFWPGRTVFAAVELIGLWAIIVGFLELVPARFASKPGKDRALFMTAAIASIVLGVALQRWVFAGAILISALVGIVAAARGFSLIVTGVSERTEQLRVKQKQEVA
jgi:uncharacterized membrane protein HdeD (DUF308 family)